MAESVVRAEGPVAVLVFDNCEHLSTPRRICGGGAATPRGPGVWPPAGSRWAWTASSCGGCRRCRWVGAGSPRGDRLAEGAQAGAVALLPAGDVACRGRRDLRHWMGSRWRSSSPRGGRSMTAADIGGQLEDRFRLLGG